MTPEANAHAMRSGLTLGAIFAVNYVLSTFPAVSFFSWVIELFILWLVYKITVKCRDEVLGGVISYGSALWFNVQLFLYSAMVAGVFKYVYLKFLRPGYLDEMQQLVMRTFEQMHIDSSTQEQVISTLDQTLTPENIALYSVMGDVMLGFLVGLVVAAIVRRD